ncbi:MAG: cobyrinate a,c-diamide synthase [Hyphomonadaceae bacterium]|nr:cobyrinate a,c-diamide synthase [Clostridia bacterium]
MIYPRIMIAGTNSGCGKTTAVLGILSALVQKGVSVQPFKAGPDYIDPMFHKAVTGRASRNLDSFLCTPETVRHLFLSAASSCDISVIEGVMGLFDGVGGNTSQASSADIAKITQTPVILVVDVKGMSLSLAAMINGFNNFDPSLRLAGVLLNGVKTPMHYAMLKAIVEENTTVPVVGYLQKDDRFTLADRHLGLVPSEEVDGLHDKLQALGESVLQTVDMAMLQAIATQAKPLTAPTITPVKPLSKTVRIGIARDKAFNFYYQDNLDLLEQMGVQLIPFSPLQDKQLPHALDGVYIGGGYPELFTHELSQNTAMRQDILKKAQAGLPMYAECGGFLYLSKSLAGQPMVGILNAVGEMTTSLQHFGYCEVTLTENCAFGQAGDRIKAHEFHYAKSTFETTPNYVSTVQKGTRQWAGHYQKYKVIAGYPHLHFWGNRAFLEHFLGQRND